MNKNSNIFLDTNFLYQKFEKNLLDNYELIFTNFHYIFESEHFQSINICQYVVDEYANQIFEYETKVNKNDFLFSDVKSKLIEILKDKEIIIHEYNLESVDYVEKYEMALFGRPPFKERLHPSQKNSENTDKGFKDACIFKSIIKLKIENTVVLTEDNLASNYLESNGIFVMNDKAFNAFCVGHIIDEYESEFLIHGIVTKELDYKDISVYFVYESSIQVMSPALSISMFTNIHIDDINLAFLNGNNSTTLNNPKLIGYDFIIDQIIYRIYVGQMSVEKSMFKNGFYEENCESPIYSYIIIEDEYIEMR
jgi:hypothetical protein